MKLYIIICNLHCFTSLISAPPNIHPLQIEVNAIYRYRLMKLKLMVVEDINRVRVEL